MRLSVIAFSIGFKLGKFIGTIIHRIEIVITDFLSKNPESKTDNIIAMELIR